MNKVIGRYYKAVCPFCRTITKIQHGKKQSGCGHYRKLELAHENKVMAMFQGDWGVEVEEESNA